MAKHCQDCCENDDFMRRTRCPQCGCLVCGFCYERFHKTAIAAERPCRTQKPSTINA